MIAGFATRAIKCDGVHDWDLRNDCLLWSNFTGDVSIRSLRSTDGHHLNHSKTLDLAVHGIMPQIPTDTTWMKRPETHVLYTQLISSEEILVTVSFTLKDADSTGSRKVQKIIKFSERQGVLWSYSPNARIARPAVSKKFIYLVIHDKDRSSLMKLGQIDGSVIFDKPFDDNLRWEDAWTYMSLSLSVTEDWIYWNSATYSNIIFAASDGQVRYRDHESYFSLPVPSSIHVGFWTEWRNDTKLLTYNEGDAEFRVAQIILTNHFDHLNHVLDGDRSLFFHLVHDRLPVGSHDPFALLGISQAIPTSSMAVSNTETSMAPSGYSKITLPGKIGKSQPRRDLEIETSWFMEDDNILRMVNDYLVFKAPSDQSLVLVDFWPDW